MYSNGPRSEELPKDLIISIGTRSAMSLIGADSPGTAERDNAIRATKLAMVKDFMLSLVFGVRVFSSTCVPSSER